MAEKQRDCITWISSKAITFHCSEKAHVLEKQRRQYKHPLKAAPRTAPSTPISLWSCTKSRKGTPSQSSAPNSPFQPHFTLELHQEQKGNAARKERGQGVGNEESLRMEERRRGRSHFLVLPTHGWSTIAWSRLTATSASWVQVILLPQPLLSSWDYRITGARRHHAWLIFILLLETRFHHVGQAGLKLLTSGDPPVSGSQSAGIKRTESRSIARLECVARSRLTATPFPVSSILLPQPPDWDYRRDHHVRLIFCTLVGRGFTVWPGWSRSLDLVIHPPRPPKVLGLQAFKQILLPHSPESLKLLACATATGFHHVGEAGLQLLASSDLSALASQSAGITGVSHRARHGSTLFFLKVLKSRHLKDERWSLALMPRLEYSGMISAHCNLCLTGLNEVSPIGQAGLEMLTSGDLPALTSQSPGITGVGHRAQPPSMNSICSHKSLYNPDIPSMDSRSLDKTLNELSSENL
ncbi:LOW QUALITY PROTEIN: hypothetical protein AAY473_000466 [Plecturocebus cupreus]